MKKICVSEACIGCGACVSIANELFDFDESGYSHPLKENIETKEEIELANQAAGACPVEAISIEDEEEEKVVEFKKIDEEKAA